MASQADGSERVLATDSQALTEIYYREVCEVIEIDIVPANFPTRQPCLAPAAKLHGIRETLSQAKA